MAVVTASGRAMVAAATGGQTIGASAGAFEIAPIGTVAPNDNTLFPLVLTQVQTSAPFTGRHSPWVTCVFSQAASKSRADAPNKRTPARRDAESIIG